jgi:hypothetical protein
VEEEHRERRRPREPASRQCTPCSGLRRCRGHYVTFPSQPTVGEVYIHEPSSLGRIHSSGRRPIPLTSGFAAQRTAMYHSSDGRA